MINTLVLAAPAELFWKGFDRAGLFIRAARLISGETPLPNSLLFERDEFVVARVSGLLEYPLPFFRRVKRAACELPIHQVHLLALVAVGFNADVFRAATDTLDFL